MLSSILRKVISRGGATENQMADTCPITQRHKSDLDVPVLNIADGQWYEYAPIMLWLESNGTSPVTRVACEPCDLVAPNDIWLVIDTSGSMSVQATNANVKEQTDLCIMDLVGYSCVALLRSIMTCRHNQFTFGAIFYNSVVTYTFQRQLLTKASLTSFEEELRSHARPHGMTNWSSPLREVLGHVSSQSTDIIFLTDGLPNVALDAVQSSVSDNIKSNNNVSLHAVAIGYGGIDCGVLSDLSRLVKVSQSEEQYARCPGGMYFIASVTDVMDSVLTLATSIAVQPSDDRKRRRLGNLDPQQAQLVDLLRKVIAVTKPQVSRFSGTMDATATQLQAARQLVEQYQRRSDNPLFEPDIVGAIASLKSFSTWGSPFIHALLDSHESMQTRNKYDTTCQSYASLHQDWAPVYEQVAAVFKSLPMPTSILSKACQPHRPQGHCNTSPTPGATMAQTYMTCGGCISADTLVMVPGDEAWVPASSLRYGMDVVVSAECVANIDNAKKPYKTAKIELIMETSGALGFEMIVIDKDVSITPHHPVQLTFGGEWMFPAELPHTSVERSSSKLVYSFALEGEEGTRAPNIITKGSTQWVLVATLAHGLEGPVIGHGYFGTDRVVDDLYKLNPVNGKVSLEPEHFKRRGGGGSDVCSITKDP